MNIHIFFSLFPTRGVFKIDEKSLDDGTLWEREKHSADVTIYPIDGVPCVFIAVRPRSVIV